jgi:hypothetical protein
MAKRLPGGSLFGRWQGQRCCGKTYCTAGSLRTFCFMLISLPPRTAALGFAPRAAAEFDFLLPLATLLKLFFWMAMTISLPVDSI